MAPRYKPFILEPYKLETRAQFASSVWADAFFDDPNLTPTTNTCRISPVETFLHTTLNTPATIPAWQSFQCLSPSPGMLFSTITLLKLGSGMNGHENVAHGGFLSLILDEIVGTAAGADRLCMTASLKIDYKAPVYTPGVVLCRAHLVRREGRKLYGTGSVEDSNGKVLATAEGLFLSVESVKPQLKL